MREESAGGSGERIGFTPGTLEQRGGRALMDTYARYPLELVAGRGTRVTDSAGREYLDLGAGIAVSVLGHRHPALVRALREGAGGLVHVSNLYWTEPMVRLAERLLEAAGMERAFFCNSGAEAVEAAFKLSRVARPGRPVVVCFEGSFHGRTFGALSLTAQARYQEPFRPLLPGVRTAPFGDFDAAAGAIAEDVAAVFVEPVQGEGGIRPAPAGWLAHLRERCDESGALLVFDEIQCGMGRTGRFLACHEDGVLPDAVTIAKALAGGLPMGALLARGEAATTFRPGQHASTFGGGPFVSGVANAVLDVLLAPGFLEGVRGRGERLRAGLQGVVDAGHAAEVRGRGLMQGLALDRAEAAGLVARLQDRGVLAVPAGPAVVRFVPSLTVTDAEIDEGVAAVAAAAAELARQPSAVAGP